MNVDKVFNIIYTLAVLGIAIGGMWYVSFLTYSTFHPELVRQQNITFNVIGIENATNATSLVQVQAECIKQCGWRFQDSGLGYLQACYNACLKMGARECPVCLAQIYKSFNLTNPSWVPI